MADTQSNGKAVAEAVACIVFTGAAKVLERRASPPLFGPMTLAEHEHEQAVDRCLRKAAFGCHTPWVPDNASMARAMTFTHGASPE